MAPVLCLLDRAEKFWMTHVYLHIRLYNKQYITTIYTYIEYFWKVLLFYNRLIGLVGRLFANGPEDLSSIPGRVIPKNFKIVLDTSLLNTQQYKVRIKGKVEQSWE